MKAAGSIRRAIASRSVGSMVLDILKTECPQALFEVRPTIVPRAGYVREPPTDGAGPGVPGGEAVLVAVPSCIDCAVVAGPGRIGLGAANCCNLFRFATLCLGPEYPGPPLGIGLGVSRAPGRTLAVTHRFTQAQCLHSRTGSAIGPIRSVQISSQTAHSSQRVSRPIVFGKNRNPASRRISPSRGGSGAMDLTCPPLRAYRSAGYGARSRGGI